MVLFENFWNSVVLEDWLLIVGLPVPPVIEEKGEGFENGKVNWL